jgi:hypothetical protein
MGLRWPGRAWAQKLAGERQIANGELLESRKLATKVKIPA